MGWSLYTQLCGVVHGRMATADSLYCTVPGMGLHMENKECGLEKPSNHTF